MDSIDSMLAGDPRDDAERGKLIGKGNIFPFETISVVPTIAEYKVECRLQGHIYLRDNYAGEDNHLWEKDYDRVCHAFNEQVFFAVLGGSHFFVLAWKKVTNELGTLKQPVVLLFEAERRNDALYMRMRENSEALINRAKGADFVTYGWAARWRLELEKVEWGLWSQTLMERNASMLHLPPKTLEAINGDIRYQEYEEVLVVAALKRRMEIERALLLGQTDQEHGSKENLFAIKTTGVAGKLRISWKLKGSWSGARLSGYRAKGSQFPVSIKDEKGNETGRLVGEEIVVDVRADSHVDLHVGEGVECAFSFVLVKEASTIFSSPVMDRINFLVRMPTAKETDALEVLVGEIKRRREVEPPRDPIQEKVDHVVRKARGRLRASTALMAEREKAKREMRDSTEFQALTEEEQNDALERVDEIFEPLWDEI